MTFTEQELKKFFPEVFNLLEGWSFILDSEGVILAANDSAVNLLPGTRKQMVGRDINEIIFSKQSDMQDAYRKVARESKNPVEYQFQARGKTFKIHVVPVFPGTGDEDCRFILRINDITENKKDEELLFRYKQMVSSVNNPIVFLDEHLKIRSYNDAFLLLYKTFEKNIIGTPIKSVFGEKNFRKLASCIKSCFTGHHIFMNDWFDFSDGIRRYMQIDFHPLKVEEDQVSGIIISQNDVSERKIIEEKLEELNRTDGLTGVYNRKKFRERLELETERYRRYGVTFSVVMFDIDHFKAVNDRCGHDVGDQVLVELTRVTRNNIRDMDLLCRWGGEEFILLLPHTGLKSAVLMADKLRKSIASHSFPETTKITCSYGVTEFRKEDNEDSLYKRVDSALYQAKNAGRNLVRYY